VMGVLVPAPVALILDGLVAIMLVVLGIGNIVRRSEVALPPACGTTRKACSFCASFGMRRWTLIPQRSPWTKVDDSRCADRTLCAPLSRRLAFRKSRSRRSLSPRRSRASTTFGHRLSTDRALLQHMSRHSVTSRGIGLQNGCVSCSELQVPLCCTPEHGPSKVCAVPPNRRLQRTLTAVSSYNGLRSESLRGAFGACGKRR